MKRWKKKRILEKMDDLLLEVECSDDRKEVAEFVKARLLEMPARLDEVVATE